MNAFKAIVVLLIFLTFSKEPYSQTTYPISSEFSYQSEPDLNRTIDQSKPVYAIPGIVDVSNGAANYNVSINIPQGINGLEPSVSIGYNSANGNGLLGYGWHLNAGGAITRTIENHLFDGKVSPIVLDGQDKINLDGQRLILYSGSNLADGSTYRTALESFQRITKKSNGGFEVKQKDGVIRHYGITAGSRLNVTNGTSTETMVWMLTAVEDRNGNFIFYDYEIDNAKNRYRLNSIRYAGLGETSNATIEFHYAQRTDATTSYLAGHGFENDLLLEQILTRSDGVEYSKYIFNYSFRTGLTGNDFSRLIEIEYYGQGTEVNSTQIKWTSSSSEGVLSTNISPEYHAQGGAYGDQVVMDINGDGIDDILSLESEVVNTGTTCDVLGDGKPPYPVDKFYFSVYANIKNTGSGNFSRSEVVQPFISDYRTGKCQKRPFSKIYAGDFNGDGLDDFILQRSHILSNSNEYFVEIYLNSPSSPGTFIKESYTPSYDHIPYGYENSSSLPEGPNQYPYHLIIADFDADGITDYSYQGSPTTTNSSKVNYYAFWNLVYIDIDPSTGSLTFQKEHVGTYNEGWGRIDSAHVGDFNGDSKPDVMLVQSLESNIVSATSRSGWELIYTGGFPNAYHYVQVGDFNGDGLSDVLTQSPSTTDDFLVTYFNGSDFVFPHIDPDISYHLDIPKWSGNKPGPINGPPLIFVVDVDLDNKADVVVLNTDNSSGTTTYTINVHYNKINGWMTSTHTIPSSLFVSSYITNKKIEIVDFNGDGRPQLFYYTNSGFPNHTFTFNFRPNDQSKFVHQILDGFNRLTEFEYDELTNPSRYSRSIYSYPNPSLIGGIKVVKSVKQKDFQQNVFVNNSYTYQDLRLNLLGLGFLGYGSMTVADNIQGVTSTSTSDLVSGSSGNSWPFLPNGSTASLNGGGSISSSEILYKSTVKQTFPNSNFNFKPQIDKVKRKTWFTTPQRFRKILHMTILEMSSNRPIRYTTTKITLLLTSSRNLPPVPTRMKAPGWIGSQKMLL